MLLTNNFLFILFILFITFNIVLVFILLSLIHFILVLIFLDILLLINILVLSCVGLSGGNWISYQYALLVLCIGAADTAIGLGLFVLYFKISGITEIK